MHREVRDEALTGELAGQPLSREIFKLVQGADAVIVAEGNTDRNVSASAWLTLRGLRTWHVGTLFAEVLQLRSHPVIGWQDAPPGIFGSWFIQVAAI